MPGKQLFPAEAYYTLRQCLNNAVFRKPKGTTGKLALAARLMPVDAAFLFVTCQIGAEPAVKAELSRRWPAFRFSYSRPGFLTFKLPYYFKTTDEFALESVFARAYGFSLGKAAGEDLAASGQVDRGRSFDRLHAWSRDEYPPGEHGYQPGATDAAVAAAEQIRAAMGDRLLAEDASSTARVGETVLDCVLVKPEEWWIGWHRAGEFATRDPGGMLNLKMPEKAVSRAWLKMEESVRWSQLPIRRGDQCAEIGCAPGGSCQALLRADFRFWESTRPWSIRWCWNTLALCRFASGAAKCGGASFATRSG